MATDHNFKVKNGLTVQGDTLVVNHTGDVDGTQVYIKKKDASTNLMRWGEGTSGVTTYKWRMDQFYEFIGNNGSDVIVLKSSDGSIQGQSYKIGATTIIDSSRNLTNIAKATLSGSGSSTSPLLGLSVTGSGAYIHASNSFASGMGSSNFVGHFFGKSGSTKNAGYIGYEWLADGDDTNYVSLGHWGNNHLLRLYADGDLNINDGGLQIGGTTVIDSSRNLTNIGSITASGNLQSQNATFTGTGDVTVKIIADTDNVTEADNPTLGFSQDGNTTGAMFVLGLEGNENTAFPGSKVNSPYIHANVNSANHPLSIANNGSLVAQFNSTSSHAALTVTKFSNITGTNGSTILNLKNYMGSSTTNGDLSQQKSFIDFQMLDSNANEVPQVRIGAEVGEGGDANDQNKEGSGAFVVYTNDADTTSGDAGASLTEKFRVAHDGTSTFTNNVVIGGNLTVNGTQTTLNTATLQVEDKNIVLNYGTGDTSGSADGAGITIQDAVNSSTDATMNWNATADQFDFSHKINISGNLQSWNVYSQDFYVLNSAGNAWHKWGERSDDRINLSVHDVSANGTITISRGGSSDIILANSNDSNYNVQLRTAYDYDGFFRVVDGGGVIRFAVGRDNQAYIGGAGGSGNKVFHDGYHPDADNADTVDNLHASQFLRSDAADTATGALTFEAAFLSKGHSSGDNWMPYTDGNFYIRSPNTHFDANVEFNDEARVVTGSIASSNSTKGLMFDGNYQTGQYRHRFRKQDNNGGLPLYIDYSAGTANSYTTIARFGPYTNNPQNFEVYGSARVDNLEVSSGGANSSLTIGTYTTTDQGYLYLTGSTANKQSVLRTTNGNLHIDCNAGNATYINYYTGSGTYFGTGAGGVAAVMGPDGDLWKGSSDNSGNKYWHAGNDGTGSGLDADTVDSIQASQFLRSDTNDTATGAIEFTNSGLKLSSHFYTNRHDANGNVYFHVGTADSVANRLNLRVYDASNSYKVFYLRGDTGDITWNGNKVWNAGNDGSGSGLDADTLDGIGSSAFLRSNVSDNYTSGTLSFNSGTALKMLNGSNFDASSGDVYVNLRVIRNAGTANTDGLYIGYLNSNSGLTRIFGGGQGSGGIYITGSGANDIKYNNSSVFWHAGNDGTGSGLDADTVDGLQASQFLRADNTLDEMAGDFSLNNRTGNGWSIHGNYFTQLLYTGNLHGGNAGYVFDPLRYKTTTFWGRSGSTWTNLGNANAILDGRWGAQFGGLSLSRSYDEFIIYFGNQLGYTLGNGLIIQHSTNGNSFDVYFETKESVTNAYESGFTTEFSQTGISSWPGGTVIRHNWAIGSSYRDNLRIRIVPNWSTTYPNNNITLGGLSSIAGYGNATHAYYTDFDKSFRVEGPEIYANSNKVWHAGNDGASSGLDADLLDGAHGSSYLRSDASDAFNTTSTSYVLEMQTRSGELISDGGNNTNFPLQIYAPASTDAAITFHVSNDYAFYFGLDHVTNDLSYGGWSIGNSKNKIWTARNDGAGSGLDADLLDGQQGSYYAPASSIPSVGNGTITISAAGSLSGGGNFTVNQSGNSTITITGPTIPTSLPANGGNADTVDNLHGSQFLRSDTSDDMTGTLTIHSGGTNSYGRIRGYGNENHFIVIRGQVTTGQSSLSITGAHRTTFVEHAENNDTTGWYFVSRQTGNYTEIARITRTGGIHLQGNKVWHAGNDGAGSGLDADLLDGIDSARIVFGSGGRKTTNADPNSNTAMNSGFYDTYQTNAPTSTWYSYITMAHTNTANEHGHQIAGSFYSDGDLYNRHYDGTNASFGNWTKLWNAANDGSGSGLDADLLDGQHGSYYAAASSIPTSLPANGGNSDTVDNLHAASFLRSDAADTATQPITLSGGSGTSAGLVINRNIATPSNYYNGLQIEVRATSGTAGIGLHRNGYSHVGIYTNTSNRLDFDFNSGDVIMNHNAGTLWGSGNDGSGSGLDADLLDGQHGSYYAQYNHFRSLGAPAFTGGSNPNITTAQYVSEMESDGAFDSFTSAFKTSWSYAGNYNLSDAGSFGPTETAGMAHLTWTDNADDTTRGNITVLAIAPNTGGSAGGVYVYNDQGSSYAPGWREIWTSATDGPGSGLDADTVDGIQGDSLLRSDANDSFTGNSLSFPTLHFSINNNNGAGSYNAYLRGTSTHLVLGMTSGNTFYSNYGNSSGQHRIYGNMYHNDINIVNIWGSGNDGSGSGLDADTLDGVQGASYLRSDTPDVMVMSTTSEMLKFQNNTSGSHIQLGFQQQDTDGLHHRFYIKTYKGSASASGNVDLIVRGASGSTTSDVLKLYSGNSASWRNNTLWDAGNDGSGSGLDADTVDSLQASQFLRSDTNDTASGIVTFSNGSNATSTSSGAVRITGGLGVGYNIYAGSIISGGSFRVGSNEIVTSSRIMTNMTLGYGPTGTRFQVGGWIDSSDGHDRLYFASGGTTYYKVAGTTGKHIWRNSFDVSRAELDVSGNFIAEGNVTAYGSASDIRLKENIEVIPDSVEKVKSLRGVTFNYKKDGKRSTGLIAQELQKVLPEAVYDTKDAPEDGEDILAIRYGNVVGLLVEALKEQQTQIDNLTTLVNELKEK